MTKGASSSRLVLWLKAHWPPRALAFAQSRARRSLRRLQPGLADNREALHAFDDCSSREFAELAESLAELDGQLAAAATAAGHLDLMLQDKEEEGAYFTAFELYKKSVDLAHASIGIALSQEEEMEQLEGRLLKNRNRFVQNSFMFRMLVLSIRAEAARIDPENQAIFAAVAGEMANMEQQMGATVATAFAELEAIVREAAAGRHELHALQADLYAGAQRSTELLRAEVDALKLKLAPCALASQEIIALLGETRGHTGSLIVSLQYQDIVRQQLAHVGEGFDDLANHLCPAGATTGIDLGYLGRAAQVQQAHLQASRQAIEKAGREIAANGEALLRGGAALIERFATMVEVADGVFRESKLGELFQVETDSLIRLAGQSEATNDRISRLLDRIERSVEVFSTDIRHHEFEVLLVALNSQIAAARIPAARALNKLAEETSDLSRDTASLTHEMSEQLLGTLVRLRDMRREADRVRATIGREKSDLTGGSALVSGKLSQLNGEIHEGSGKVARDFEKPYRRVDEVLRSLEFPAAIATCFAPAEALCARLLEVTAPFVTDALGGEGAARLAAHAGRYTMQQERADHATVLNATAPSSQPAIESIELFDEAPASVVDEVVPVAAEKVASNDPVELAKGAVDGVEFF